MTNRTSRLVLTSHITSSVGWLGAVAIFLVFAITALISQNIQLVRSCCMVMSLCTWFVIIPFCLLSLLTGIIQAAFTKWGVFKHYWIIVKLVLTVASTFLLFLHLQPINYLSGMAQEQSFTNSLYAQQIIDLIIKSGAALFVLLIITTVSVYKPWGKVSFVKNNYNEKDKNVWGNYLIIGLIISILLLIIFHLISGGLHRH